MVGLGSRLEDDLETRRKTNKETMGATREGQVKPSGDLEPEVPKETDAMVRALESEEEEPSEESEEEDEVERPPFCMKLNHDQPRAQEESEDHDYWEADITAGL